MGQLSQLELLLPEQQPSGDDEPQLHVVQLKQPLQTPLGPSVELLLQRKRSEESMAEFQVQQTQMQPMTMLLILYLRLLQLLQMSQIQAQDCGGPVENNENNTALTTFNIYTFIFKNNVDRWFAPCGLQFKG